MLSKRITDIPIEVFLDHLLPQAPVSDVLRLACTCKFFAILCADDVLWKRRLLDDFNFSGAGTARTSGWKFIYKGLSSPQVYVWGSYSNGRLGFPLKPKSLIPAVPFPVPLKFDGVRIVHVSAGGMSFHALDSHGNVYVWGTLNALTTALTSDGFSEPAKTAMTPLKLLLPVTMRSISCGRLHSSGLDSQHRVWTFLSWGRPFCLTSPLLSCILQVECGWAFSAALSRDGQVFVWFPFDGQMQFQVATKNDQLDNQLDAKSRAQPDGTIPCIPWEMDVNPLLLPSLPALPELSANSATDDEPVKLVSIAGLDQCLIGLTNRGHVVKYSGLSNEEVALLGTWEYLSKFSDVREVRENSTFAEGKRPSPDFLRITHISANFNSFVAYSTGEKSIVLIGRNDFTPDTPAEVVPELQYRSVISVVVGDYHKAALTADGKLFTWGAYSLGALGLGDPGQLPAGAPGGFQSETVRVNSVERGHGTPPNVRVPTQVWFNHLMKQSSSPEKFCISVAAAGWHTGALVINLDVSTKAWCYAFGGLCTDSV
ncbi:RCC1/BLIP-II protein [Fistulina hepatica ATCC 64428]|uniref:RCC1/BLIP-II protein n=1 Tax=Fistulina hepatica ATCC 64428 TaxID=1128425 RepID=A0A0D7ANP3_9AGAR|nr:RCC1/BLIP-II protein [Fistulina hepatica ATCC 64428]